MPLYIHCIHYFIYMNLVVSFETVFSVKWLFAFIEPKLSLNEMDFYVSFKNVDALKCVFTFFASINFYP